MGRYYISQTAINPYSFEQMYKTAGELTKAHQENQQQLALLESSTGEALSHLNPETDAEEIGFLNDYNKKVTDLADTVNKRGISGSTLNGAVQAASYYQQIVKPINDLATARIAFATSLNELKSKNPLLAIQTDPSKMSLKEFRNGTPAMKYIDGEQVRKNVTALTKAAHSGFNDLESKLKEIVGDKYHSLIAQRNGYSSELYNAYDEDTALKTAIDEYLGSLGLDQVVNPSDVDMIYTQAQLGRADAVQTWTTAASESPYYIERKLAQTDAQNSAARTANKIAAQQLKLEQERELEQVPTAMHDNPIDAEGVQNLSLVDKCWQAVCDAAKDPKKRNWTIRKILKEANLRGGDKNPFGNPLGQFFRKNVEGFNGLSAMHFNSMTAREIVGEYDNKTGKWLTFTGYAKDFTQTRNNLEANITPPKYEITGNPHKTISNSLSNIPGASFSKDHGMRKKSDKKAFRDAAKDGNGTLSVRYNTNSNELLASMRQANSTGDMANVRSLIKVVYTLPSGDAMSVSLDDVYNSIANNNTKRAIDEGMVVMNAALQSGNKYLLSEAAKSLQNILYNIVGTIENATIGDSSQVDK